MASIATVLFSLALASGAGHDITPGRLGAEARILLDTRCGDVEWQGAARVPVGTGSELLALEDEDALYLCVTLPPESYGTMDLYVHSQGSPAPVNLHASAQVGERTKVGETWPEWTFGNHDGWYSPPVAVTGATVVEGRARMTFTNAPGREVAIRKAKFGPGPWRFMIETRALGADKKGSLTFPAAGRPDDPGTWALVQLLPSVVAGAPDGATVLPITSKALGESRPVWLHTPAECTRDKPCDVLVVLDGHALFPLAVSYAQVMRMMGRMEPLIVAGIPSWSADGRARNFIPTPGRTPAEQQRGTDGSGATRFIEFLEREVVPAVEQAAPVTSKRVIAGHSLAGLFVVHALTSSNLFEGHIALSPSLGWGGQQTLVGLIARLETPMGTTRRLYASVAAEPPAYRDTFTRLERALERSKSEWLVHRLRRFDAEDHTTTVAPALHDAMKWIYRTGVSR